MRILVGVDTSVRSGRALRWALQEARAREAQVTLLYAFEVPRLRGPMNREVSLEADRQRARADVAAMIEGAGPGTEGVAIDADVVAVTDHASVAHVLLRRARSADLLVVGARGLGGFAGLLLGSVSQQVAAHASVPVAVVPGGASPRDDDFRAPRSILVGVDGSPQSTAALDWAVACATARRCPVTAVYVYPPRPPTVTSGIVDAIDRALVDGFWTHGRSEAERVVEELAAKAAAMTDVTVDPLAVPGAPAQRLLQLSAERQALVVVGSRGHGGFPGLLLGSVSSQCVYHSAGAAPVVVVHT